MTTIKKRNSIRTVISLNQDCIDSISDLINKLKAFKPTVNLSKIIRAAIYNLANLDSDRLKSLFDENKSIMRWQKSDSGVIEKNVTLTRETVALANEIKKTDVDFKFSISGIVRVGIQELQKKTVEEIVFLIE